MSKILDLMFGLATNSSTKDTTATNTPAATDDTKKLVTTEWAKLGFAISKASPGYIKFPTWMGGLVVQWGKIAAVPSGGAINITFPIPFPNNVLNVEATICNTNGNTTAMSAGVGAESATGCSLFHNGTNAATAIMWFAIGH